MYLLAGFLILTGITSVYGAEFYVEQDCTVIMTIRGAIKVNDSQKLLRAIANIADQKKLPKCSSIMKERQIVVRLDSEGGDVDVALDMGRIIRRENGFVQVWEGSKCFSSCVFILAAGVKKIAFGDIGIHRPYFSALSNTDDVSTVRAKRESLIKKIRVYFDEMDIPQGLLDLMLSIPPEEMKVLSFSELEVFRLYGYDPTYEEIKTAKTAYLWNLTSAEYRKRSARSDAICPLGSSACNFLILLNITEQEFKKRFYKYNDVCKSNNSKEQMQCFRDIVTLGK